MRTRTHAVQTPKPGQDRKGAATRDALGRRGLRVTIFLDPVVSSVHQKSPVIDRAFLMIDQKKDQPSPESERI